MGSLDLLPHWLRERSIDAAEIVLPLQSALDAIAFFEAQGIRVLGWEGWIKDHLGRVGHGNGPQGTVSLESLSVSEAAAFCRQTILSEAARWKGENPETTDELHFCIAVDAPG